MNNMNNEENAIFTELSNKLTTDERNELYEKISPYCKEVGSDEKIEEKRIPKKAEIETYTNSIYENKSLLYKFIIFLTQIIKGTTKSKAITEVEISNISKDIKSHYGDLIDTRTDSLTNHFIKQITKLAVQCTELQHLLKKITAHSTTYSEFICWLIERNLPEKINELHKQSYPNNISNKTSFVTKEKYLSERDSRLKKYFLQIDLSTFNNLNIQMTKFEILTKLIDYDFRNLFLAFSLSDFNSQISVDTSCKFIEIEPSLSRLFRILTSINFETDDIEILHLLPEFLEKHNNTDRAEEVDTEVNSIPTKDIYTKIKNLFDTINEVQAKIPMKKMMIYLNSDLMYSIKPISLKYDMTLIYKEYKRTIMEKVWNDYFFTLKKENLQTMLDQMFERHYNFDTLEYITPKLKEELEQYNYAHIPHIYMLNFLQEFLISTYKIKVELTVSKLINDGDFKKDKIRTDISSFYFLLNSFDKQIRDFDNKYNPTHDTGKELMSLLSRVLTNDDVGGPFLTSVDELNTECYKFVVDIKKSFKEIFDFLKNVNDIPNPQNVPIVNSEKIKIPGQPNLFIAVEKALEVYYNYEVILSLINDIYSD